MNSTVTLRKHRCAPGKGGSVEVSLAERVSVLKDVVSNLQIENAFADLASKLVVVTIAVGQLQTSDHFTGYPATRALEITSPDRHAVLRRSSARPEYEAEILFDLCCLDCR